MVAFYNEGNLTTAITAASDCLGDIDRNEVDGLYVAILGLTHNFGFNPSTGIGSVTITGQRG